MIMASERFAQLLTELSNSTVAGRVRWQETADESSFRVGLGDGIVRIDAGGGSDGRYYGAVLVDRYGRVVDTFRVSEDDGPDFEMVQRMYDKARVTALDVDKIVDSMLSDLKVGKVRELPPEQNDIPPF
jgi:hypothetical protein